MKRVSRTPMGKPMDPLWVGWIRIVMFLFHPPWYRGERFTDFVYNHGPVGLKRAYIWVGSAQNPRNDW